MTGASAPAAASQAATTWRNDFADPASMAALRARLLLVACAGAVLSTGGTGLSSDQAWSVPRAAAFVGAMVFLVGLGAVTWYRGARMGDTTFASMIYVAYPVIGASVILSDPTAAIPMVALCTMLPITMTVLFVQRAPVAYAGIGLAVTTVVAVAVCLPPGERIVIESLTSGLCVAVIGVTMRLVRDLAVSALARSRQVEATDALTGLQNRRGLERAGLAAWQLASGGRVPLSALVLDVDNFKRINDGQGHAAGDEVLRRLGALLNRLTGADDVVARLGGEEFLVLSTCPDDGARAYASRLRRAIEQELAPVTVSIGVHTEFPAGDGEWPAAVWTMVNSADRALYRAKASGRNQVVTSADLDRTPAVAGCPALPAPREARPSPEDGREPAVSAGSRRRRGGGRRG